MLEAEQIMKRCQIGTRNYEEANNLHAECYRIIGKLLAEREWVDLSDAQIGQVYFDVVQVHRGAPMPWGQVQFGRALLDKFKEVNT